MAVRWCAQQLGRHYDKVARGDVLWRAWAEVALNQGAPGIDGVSIASIEDRGVEGVRALLDTLAAALRDKQYRPQRLRRVHIPKPDGHTRPLGIPTVADRVVMTAAKLVLEPIFEADFAPVSFGFRPKRSAHMALEVIRVEANRGAEWVLDADIASCFDEIDHDALMAQLERRVSDRQLLKLVRSWLRVGVIEGGVITEVDSGTPQGSPISPLLANVVLHVLDTQWMATGNALGNAGALRGRLCDTNARRDRCRRSNSTSGAAPEMEVGPPGSPCRGRSQTTASCVGQEPGW